MTDTATATAAPDSWEDLPNFVSASDTLVCINKTMGFLNPRDNRYYYFKVKVGEVKGLFMDLQLNPPVTMNGFLGLAKKIYKVTTNHLLKRKVYVSPNNEYVSTTDSASLASINSGTSTSSTTRPGTVDSPQVEVISETSEQCFFSEETWVADDAAANALVEEQVRELQQL